MSFLHLFQLSILPSLYTFPTRAIYRGLRLSMSFLHLFLPEVSSPVLTHPLQQLSTGGLDYQYIFFYLFQLKYNRPFPACQNHPIFSQKYWLRTLAGPSHRPMGSRRSRPAGAAAPALLFTKGMQTRICAYYSHL